MSARVALFFTLGQDAHLLPVVGKLFAAVNASHVGSGSPGGAGPAISSLTDRKRGALMCTTEQKIPNFHLLLHLENPRIDLFWQSASNPTSIRYSQHHFGYQT